MKTLEFTGEQINMVNEALLWYINSAEFNNGVPKEVLATLPKYKDLLKYINSEIMTIAEKINAQRASEFEKEFDLETFDRFVEEQVSNHHSVTIGLCSEWLFDDYLQHQRQFKDWYSNSKWLTFANAYRCYVWNTNCQIPQKFMPFVIRHLQEQGLRVNQKGACGYATYDVIEIKL
jgi:hypothetical protein